MINGAHLLLYSTNPEADQAVLNDLLKLGSVPAEGLGNAPSMRSVGGHAETQ